MTNLIPPSELPAIGAEMHNLATRLWPICRSLTGQGVRETLSILKEKLSGLEVHEIPSGTQCFDWVIPEEWNISAGYIIDPTGEKIVDFSKNNLHVVGYSTPINQKISLDELQNHLYSLPDQPTAIPYITSYYKKHWGFCLSHNQRMSLKAGTYQVVIESQHTKGSLTYAELLIPGESKEEIFLSTYICHPSMANNELSGPVVTTALAGWLLNQPKRRYSYRIVMLPETIGAIAYTAKHLEALKKNVVAGFVITCIGDERAYSFLPSRKGGTLSDRVALHVLKYLDSNFKKYSFLDRGSDERQYCSPGVDLPMCSIMRSKYGVYPEYHTSLDDLNFVTPVGLAGGFDALQKALAALEASRTPRTKVPCEPQLGKRGLYPNLSVKNSTESVRNTINFLAYADGTADLLSICETINASIFDLLPIVQKLSDNDLIEFL